MFFEPTLNWWALMSSVVVHDQMNIQLGCGLRIYDPEEFDEFSASMPRQTFANHRAIQHIQSGKQGRCPISFVIVSHGCASSLFHWQSGLGAIQRLNLTLLIHRQHQRMLRWVEIEPDNGLQLVCEVRIVAPSVGAEGAAFQRSQTVGNERRDASEITRISRKD